MNPDNPFLTFRAAETRQVFTYLSAGESCQVIGADGSGKSNLMQFLAYPEIIAKYLGEENGKYSLIYLNNHLLLAQNDWGLYELMLHKLVKHLESRDAPEPVLHTMDELHRRAIDPGSMHLALRYLDRALSLILRSGSERVVFLLDEFDLLARAVSPACFSTLRGLRDEYKYRLMYVIAANRELRELRESTVETEHFNDLVSGHEVWLMSYSAEDARWMIHRLASRSQFPISEADTERLLRVSGGHPGLIRAAFHTLQRGLPVEIDGMLADPLVKEECQQIWRSLALAEQRALVLAAGVSPGKVDAQMAQHLREKGLVLAQSSMPADAQGQEGALFSPLFACYLQEHTPETSVPFEIDRKHREVWVLGKRITDLTAQEFSFIDYLEQHQGEACRSEDIAGYYYQTTAGVSQPKSEELGSDVFKTAVDATIKRLRRKIEPDPGKSRFIVNVRGVGYKLVV